MTERREFLAGAAALATARWRAEGYDPSALESWDELDHGIYETGSLDPSTLYSHGGGKVAGWNMEDEDFDETSVSVFYDPHDIHLDVDGSSDLFSAGMLATLEADQARDLAAALFQAAEELDRRPDGTR